MSDFFEDHDLEILRSHGDNGKRHILFVKDKTVCGIRAAVLYPGDGGVDSCIRCQQWWSKHKNTKNA